MEEKEGNVRVCAHCGKVITSDNYEVVDGDEICCDCIAADYVECYECGNYILKSDVYHIYNGDKPLCDDCYESNYIICEDCGDVVRINDATEIDDRMVCFDCRDVNYFWCDECGKWHPNNDRNVTYDGNEICDGCYHEYYFMCNICGEIHHNDDYVRNHMCCHCHDQLNRDEVMGYHEFERSNYHPQFADGEAHDAPTFGIELECDDGSFDHCDFESWSDDIHFESDSSLSNDGVECISQPMSLKRHHEFAWREIVNSLLQQGFRSHDTDSCGLHVHIGRDALNVLSIVKMDVWLNRWMLWRDIARRDTIYGRGSRSRFDAEKRIDISNAVNNHDNVGCLSKYKTNGSDRYQPLNTRNEDTVEIRIFRGTLNYETLIGTIEACAAMLAFAPTVGIVHVYDADLPIKFVEFIAERKAEYSHVLPMLKRLVKRRREPSALVEIIDKA